MSFSSLTGNRERKKKSFALYTLFLESLRGGKKSCDLCVTADLYFSFIRLSYTRIYIHARGSRPKVYKARDTPELICAIYTPTDEEYKSWLYDGHSPLTWFWTEYTSVSIFVRDLTKLNNRSRHGNRLIYYTYNIPYIPVAYNEVTQ